MPTPVEAIGDGAFENCQKLATIELYSPDRVTALKSIITDTFEVRPHHQVYNISLSLENPLYLAG